MLKKNPELLYYLAALCFLLAAVFNLFGGQLSSGTVMLAVGAALLAVGLGGRKKKRQDKPDENGRSDAETGKKGRKPE